MKKVKETVEIEFDGKKLTVSKRQAKRIQRIKEKIAKDEAFAAMTPEEKKSYVKKLCLKIGGIGAGALALVVGLLVALGSKGKSDDNGDTVLLDETSETEEDDSDDTVE